MRIADVFKVKGPEFFIARSTLIITQTDGRTAYADNDGFVFDIATPQAFFDITFFQTYSDRVNNVAPNFPPPNQRPGIPWQMPQGFSNRATDATRVTINKSSIQRGVKFTADFQLLTWNQQFSLDFTYVRNTGIYQSSGPTIGNAPGMAFYSLAFRI